MQLPLEDFASDILSKASNGHRISPAMIATRCGIHAADVEAAIADPAGSPHTAAIAAVLGIDPVRLDAVAHGRYMPAPVSINGLAHFNTPFEDMTVNSFLVWDPGSRQAAAFDTGSDCDGLVQFATTQGLKIGTIFLTHAHGDHIFDLDRLIKKTGAPAYTPVGEPVERAEAFAPGATFAIGALSVETRLTFGHCNGGVTYVVQGLDRPLAICGDAVFAGSMGGGKISYADAIRTNREEIFTLSDETILCPGHGPLTTVGEERRNNPFFSDQ
jgi:glyoxylase-like metal-dependent hydrolase (beta-lactamase superfamily II)